MERWAINGDFWFAVDDTRAVWGRDWGWEQVKKHLRIDNEEGERKKWKQTYSASA
jgi:hypothetical protein